MILIDDILVSEDIIEKEFVCNLSACKGQCCVGGDIGAPLEEEELKILEKIWPKVKPYVPDEGRKAIDKQGKWVEVDGEYCTPLVKGAECAYTFFVDGIAQCSIERAFLEGKIDFRKPVSCHLYPIRVSYNQRTQVTRANYDRWDICQPACANGKKLQVPLYKFVKAPLIRKFGEPFYLKLEEIADAYLAQKKES